MTRRKLALILTADAGFGHRSAANALAAALRETHGAECDHEIINILDDPKVPRRLRAMQSDYDHIARDMPGLYGFGYKATDAETPAALIKSGLQAMLYGATRRLLADKKPDLLISTYPLYPSPLGAVFSITGTFIPLVTVVTDLVTVHQMWFCRYSDLTVVPTKAVRALAMKARLPADAVEVIGIPVNPALGKEKRARQDIRSSLGWDRDLTPVLLVGSKRSSLYVEVAHALNHSGLPLQLIAVAGGDDERYHELRRTEWHCPAHVYNFTDRMPEMMKAAGCIVCKAGGLTVSEALACGLPLLLTDVIPGQETGNAEYVVGGGAGEVVDRPLGALDTIFHWLRNGGVLLKKRSAAAARLGRPRAAYDIIERAWALAESGPAARKTSQILALPRLLSGGRWRAGARRS